MKTKKPAPDFRVYDEGSIVLLRPQTPAANAWVADHLPEDAPTFGHSYVINTSSAQPVIDGILAAGLRIAI